jgi:hypothetical protein
MGEHLDKAKAALDAARDLDPSDLTYMDLLTISRLQAEIAQAEALTEIASSLRALTCSQRWGEEVVACPATTR